MKGLLLTLFVGLGFLAIGAAPASATPDLPDAEALEAIAIVRRRLKNPGARFALREVRNDRLRQPSTATVAVTVFADQAPPLAVRSTQATLAESVASAADALIGQPAALFYALDRSDELAVLIEVGAGPRLIWPLDPANPRAMGSFELGVDALHLTSRNSRGEVVESYISPSAMVTSAESDPEEIIKLLGRQAVIGATPQGELLTLESIARWDADVTRLYADRMAQYAQARAGAPLLRTMRLAVPVTAVDVNRIERALRQAMAFLKPMQTAQGLLIEHYGPTQKGVQLRDRPSLRAQALALEALNRVWDTTRDDTARAMAVKLAQALAGLAEAEGGKAWFRHSDTAPADTALTAECALALARSPDGGQHRELLGPLGAFLLSMRAGDGHFHSGYSKLLGQPLEKQDSASGVAARALAELGHRLRRDDLTQAARASAEVLLAQRLRDMRDGQLSLAHPEEFELFERMALTDEAFLEILDPIPGMLASAQFRGRQTPYPDYIGAFERRTRVGGFDFSAYHAGHCLRLLHAATQARRRAGRGVEEDRTTMARAARFVLQLQIQEDEAFFCPNPQAAAGLLRTDLVNPDMLLGNMANALIGLCHALETIGGQHVEFPDAAAPERGQATE